MTDFFSSILNWIYSFIPNYGWAVVVFTLLIRLVLLPLDIKSKKSMRAMSKIQPKVQELQKKYGKDRDKLNQKTQELYKKENVKPLAGCLPLLIQLPLLFFMFAAMRKISDTQTANELIALFNRLIENGSADGVERIATQGFLWIKNIFQPDSFSSTILPSFSSAMNTIKSAEIAFTAPEGLEAIYNAYIAANFNPAGSFGAIKVLFWTIKYPMSWTVLTQYANGLFLLPIFAAASQIIMTKLQPAQQQNTDPNSPNANPMNGNFMKWFFPLLSLYFCASYTSAFAVYWVASNLIQLVQQFAINKYFERKDKLDAQALISEDSQM